MSDTIVTAMEAANLENRSEACVGRQHKELELEASQALGILAKLPIEIRMKIYRFLFRCDGTIIPQFVQYHALDNFMPKPVEYRAWVWDNPLTVFQPYRHSIIQTGFVTTPKWPAVLEVEHIGQHESVPRDVRNQRAEMMRRVRFESGRSYAVIERFAPGYVSKGELLGLRGLALLRACKQLRRECSSILYGENSFAFSTAENYSLEDDRVKLLRFIQSISGQGHFPHLSEATLSKRVCSLFEAQHVGEDCIARNPLLNFFRRIGQFGTAALSSIELKADLKTSLSETILDNRAYTSPPVGFGTLLSMYAIVLRRTCPPLRLLALEMSDTREKMASQEVQWERGRPSDQYKTDDQCLHEVIGQLVHELDSLAVLQLGGYGGFVKDKLRDIRFERPGTITGHKYLDELPIGGMNEWGTSVKWMEFVKLRTEKRALDEAAKKGRN